ncbi:MAG: hypothetical protein WC444_04095 [Candidatus Paceibacterota bacterium]
MLIGVPEKKKKIFVQDKTECDRCTPYPSFMAEEEKKSAKVVVSRGVYVGLKKIHAHMTKNGIPLVDENKALLVAKKIKEEKASVWIERNPERYGIGSINGFECQEALEGGTKMSKKSEAKVDKPSEKKVSIRAFIVNALKEKPHTKSDLAKAILEAKITTQEPATLIKYLNVTFNKLRHTEGMELVSEPSADKKCSVYSLKSK